MRKPYIFISYSHLDSECVEKLISRLFSEGYNIWYDEGIEPGTDWDENIAMHIIGSSYFISFLSSNYISSNNCKDELNYARDMEKPQLLVYLEDIALPAGMAMRLNRLQSIYWNRYSDAEQAFAKLFSASGIEAARVLTPNKHPEPNNEEPVSAKEDPAPVIIPESANNEPEPANASPESSAPVVSGIKYVDPYVNCPGCGAKQNRTAVSCSQCGTVFIKKDPSTGKVDNISVSGTYRLCNGCGVKLLANSERCPKCGAAQRSFIPSRQGKESPSQTLIQKLSAPDKGRSSCIKCGSSLRPGQSYCFVCNTDQK